MDNASKNTKDMIGLLQMKYNRGRQAAITNKLVDIITGKFNALPCIPSLHTPFNLFCVTIFVDSGFWLTTPFFTGVSAP
jgi:ATP synthase